MTKLEYNQIINTIVSKLKNRKGKYCSMNAVFLQTHLYLKHKGITFSRHSHFLRLSSKVRKALKQYKIVYLLYPTDLINETIKKRQTKSLSGEF